MPPATNAQLPTGTVTFLFTDIEGSTRLLHELGDGYVRRAASTPRSSAPRSPSRRGIEVGTEGDSFFAAVPLRPAPSAAAVARNAHWRGHVAATARPSGSAWACTPARGALGGDRLRRDGRQPRRPHRRRRPRGPGARVGEHPRPRRGSPAGRSGFRDLGEHRLKDFAHPSGSSSWPSTVSNSDFSRRSSTLDARPTTCPCS